MFKTIDCLCEGCQDIHIETVDVPYGAALPDVVTCTKCGHAAKRILSFQIAKREIEARCHPPEIIDGKFVSRDGYTEGREQRQLEKRLKAAQKAKDATTAREVQTELNAKRGETLKKLKGE